MKYILLLLFSALLCAELLAQRPKIVVETPTDSAARPTTFEYLPPTDSTGPRVVIDPGELIYQMTLDSINKSAEDKIREQIISLEKHFEDPVFEEQVGRAIGAIIMDQQMALLDLQVTRAISLRDSLLMIGVEIALREMIKQNPQLEYELTHLHERIEKEFVRLYRTAQE